MFNMKTGYGHDRKLFYQTSLLFISLHLMLSLPNCSHHAPLSNCSHCMSLFNCPDNSPCIPILPVCLLLSEYVTCTLYITLPTTVGTFCSLNYFDHVIYVMQSNKCKNIYIYVMLIQFWGLCY